MNGVRPSTGLVYRLTGARRLLRRGEAACSVEIGVAVTVHIFTWATPVVEASHTSRIMLGDPCDTILLGDRVEKRQHRR